MTERFEDYAIRIVANTGYVIDYEVKSIAGETIDPLPSGEWLYELANASSWAETTTVFEEGEMFLSGQVKWDGCSNWDFHTEDCMKHFCGRGQAAGIGRLMDRLYQIAKDQLQHYDQAVAEPT